MSKIVCLLALFVMLLSPLQAKKKHDPKPVVIDPICIVGCPCPLPRQSCPWMPCAQEAPICEITESGEIVCMYPLPICPVYYNACCPDFWIDDGDDGVIIYCP